MRTSLADPTRHVTFYPATNTPRLLSKRRVGRPRHHWIEEGLKRVFKIAAHNHATRHMTSTAAFIPGRDWYYYTKETYGPHTYHWVPIPPPPLSTHDPPLTLAQAKHRKKKFHRRIPPGNSFYFPASPDVSSVASSDTDPISDSLSGTHHSGESHSDDSSIYSHTSFDHSNYYHRRLLLNSSFARES